MKKSIALISVFAVLMIAFSGCVDNSPAVNGTDSDNPETNPISDDDAAGVSTIENPPQQALSISIPSRFPQMR